MRTVQFMLILSLSFLFVVQQTAATQEAPRDGGTLIVALSGEPPIIDVLSTSLHATRVAALICETLVAEDTRDTSSPAPPIVPGLAESWSVSDDGVTYTFHLRQNVTFTDGTRFDAYAVHANFDRYMLEDSIYAASPTARGIMASRVSAIRSYRVVDAFTFEVTLHEPFGSFIRGLTHRNFGVVSPAALERASASMSGEDLVCTGPFKFSRRDLGVSVTLERNTDYWNSGAGGPYLDNVVFAIMPDSSSRIAALQRGEIDVDLEVAAGREQELEDNPHINLTFPSNAHIAFWMFNHQDPLVQDPRVRQAIWHAFDSEGLVSSVFGERAVPVAGLLPPGNPGYRQDLERRYPYDPERARQLLADAGFAEGLELSIGYPTAGGSYMDPGVIAQWLQGNLRSVGVDATLEVFELSAFQAYFSTGLDERVQIALQGWQSIANDPLMLEQLWGTTAIVPHGFNRGWHSNPHVDDLLADARRQADEERSLTLYLEAEDVLVTEVAAIPIAHDRQPRAARSSVQDLVFGPSPWFELTSVWLSD